MKFIAHPNLPSAWLDVLRLIDFENVFELFPYPESTPPDEWLQAIGKEAPKPIILGLDAGMLRNAVTKRLLRESGCTFVFFAKRWTETGWVETVWRLVQCWSNVLNDAKTCKAHTAIEVALKGKCFRQNL